MDCTIYGDVVKMRREEEKYYEQVVFELENGGELRIFDPKRLIKCEAKEVLE